MTPEEITAQKDVEFYASNVDAWFNTSLEFDKSILALSAGGIGLLVTLLTTIGLSSMLILIMYISAILGFLIALASVLFVFQRNRSYIETVVTGRSAGSDHSLALADKAAILAFGAAVILTAFIGVVTAITSYTSKEQSMAKDQKITVGNVTVDTMNIRESFNGAARLQQPTVDFTKSFNGVANLKPSSPAASTATTQAPTSPTATAATGAGNDTGKK